MITVNPLITPTRCNMCTRWATTERVYTFELKSHHHHMHLAVCQMTECIEKADARGNQFTTYLRGLYGAKV